MKKALILSFIWIGFFSFSQGGKLKKADRYYEKLSYAYAAELYEQLIGSKVETPMVNVNLARSYYFIGDMAKAEPALAKIVNSAIAKKDDIFYYAQALKQNGKIEQSDEWMNKFRNKVPNDLRGMSYTENTDYFARIMAQGKKFDIKNLAINTSSADFGGYPTVDGKGAYFVSNRRKRTFVKNEWSWNKGRFLDLYAANIAENREFCNADRMTPKTNSIYHEGPLAFSPDGKTVYFTRNNVAKGKQRRDQNGIQNLKLYRAYIDSSGKWINEEALSFNSKEYSVGHPAISADGKTMYFASDMPGGFGGADLYQLEIKVDGSYGIPVNLGKEINTEGQDMFPWISNDGNLFFSSNGRIGLGGLDVFVVFPSGNGFGNMMNLGLPINGEHDDFAFTMNPDTKTGYFSSNRAGGKGDDDIYSYALIAPLRLRLNLKGVVTDKATKLIISNALVELLDGSGNVISAALADNSGNYKFDLEPELNYQVKATKDNYYENKTAFSTSNLAVGTDLIKKNLLLEKDSGFGLYTLVTDAKTAEPLNGVRMKIKDLLTGKTLVETITTETGDNLNSILDHIVGDKISYKIDLMKEGYFPKSLTFNSEISKPGIINVHDLLSGSLAMDKAVKDLTEMIKINPINFDLNKFNIRPDAKVELNKIVEVMNKYPEMEIELGSHTDCRASIAYNEKLSDKRAKASAAYIKSKITNPDRIYGKGYGESKLLNDCGCEGNMKSDCSEKEHELNRRTEFRVIYKDVENLRIIDSSDDSYGN